MLEELNQAYYDSVMGLENNKAYFIPEKIWDNFTHAFGRHVKETHTDISITRKDKSLVINIGRDESKTIGIQHDVITQVAIFANEYLSAFAAIIIYCIEHRLLEDCYGQRIKIAPIKPLENNSSYLEIE